MKKNCRKLFLSQNHIVDLKGLAQLQMLEQLSLTCNDIKELDQLKWIPKSVLTLSLNGNPIASHTDYRHRVLRRLSQLEALDSLPVTDRERRVIERAVEAEEWISDIFWDHQRWIDWWMHACGIVQCRLELLKKRKSATPLPIMPHFRMQRPTVARVSMNEELPKRTALIDVKNMGMVEHAHYVLDLLESMKSSMGVRKYDKSTYCISREGSVSIIISELVRRCKNAPTSILERVESITFESSNSDFIVSLEHLLIDILAKQRNLVIKYSGIVNDGHWSRMPQPSRLLEVHEEPDMRVRSMAFAEHRSEPKRKMETDDKTEDGSLIMEEMKKEVKQEKEGGNVKKVGERVHETRSDFTPFVAKKVRFNRPIGKEWIQHNVVPWAMQRIEKHGKLLCSRAFRKWKNAMEVNRKFFAALKRRFMRRWKQEILSRRQKKDNLINFTRTRQLRKYFNALVENIHRRKRWRRFELFSRFLGTKVFGRANNVKVRAWFAWRSAYMASQKPILMQPSIMEKEKELHMKEREMDQSFTEDLIDGRWARHGAREYDHDEDSAHSHVSWQIWDHVLSKRLKERAEKRKRLEESMRKTSKDVNSILLGSETRRRTSLSHKKGREKERWEDSDGITHNVTSRLCERVRRGMYATESSLLHFGVSSRKRSSSRKKGRTLR
eukprot:TRINITY_DN1068_c1_g2_i9.p1 TRINITY_DN1068_c1_g2~~TRINITY_DN1068_c1_g2_i9.p1  ORF type:complete len:708 (+),score=188.97 TRINITY_DN1068_c1_g2_i9:125-2125(+)